MHSPLGQLLQQGLASRGLTVEVLSDRTKIPKSNIQLLLGEDDGGILPARTYLRGHLTVIAKELGLSVPEVLAALEVSHPAPPQKELIVERRLPAVTIAVAAGLGGIAILAVVIAFASALG
ncbi:MAG: helix-turn-helix domain-containing protein [Deltaproteobacteria bacterium]|jgi:cytoskeletal protein RodZ|nr:helix-turn-helix domain-containing protein [Deltaproteobacteria bacterium]